jgi:hypothetical protein
VFETKLVTVRLAGEGVMSVDVLFNPIKMLCDIVKGGLYILDSSGSRLATCSLIGTTFTDFNKKAGLL